MDTYDKTSVDSIYEFSLQLAGKTLRSTGQLPADITNSRNKGDLGSLVEKYYFKHVPPNDHYPDFREADLELKTTGVRKSKNSTYAAKERLSLGMINFNEIVLEEFENSNLYRKCKCMLLLFYEYVDNTSSVDLVFNPKPYIYKMVEHDLEQIKRDWNFIKTKVMNGQAHELSEGDTLFLGASTKGANSKSLTTQPFSDIKAKTRGFSFKPSYLNRILQISLQKDVPKSGASDIQLETLNKFSPYLNVRVSEIEDKFGVAVHDKKSKNHYRNIANRICQIKGNLNPDFEKAGITMKTIRLKANGMPREDMSFPAFDYFEVLQKTWEESDFYEIVNSRFFFVIFKDDEAGDTFLHKVGFWNMPYVDRLEAEKVYVQTKKQIESGAHEFPSSKQNNVSHVRPHGKNGQDLVATPLAGNQIRRCFWLNKRYLREVVKSI